MTKTEKKQQYIKNKYNNAKSSIWKNEYKVSE